uniref:Gelsolin-like domain-containing protein n=1 Tax=Astatotilapia calliptera TaxID=8154 RepID=A0AAX7V5N6_ASTCA
MAHKEFETAGKKPGLQVWRVENMDLKPVPPALYGDFFTGDAYILLYTTKAPSYNVHSWIGDEASQDESGAAAIFITQLDDHLQGAAIQYNEFQNQESTTFLGYFKSGIKYKKGGVASGFKHVVTNDVDVKRLLHLKGRRPVRATEEDLSWQSFNKGDSFIIDLGKVIYNLKSNHFEKLKTTQMARDIRDNERNGRGEVHTIDEGKEPEAVTKVLGPKPDLAPGGSDTDVEKTNRNKISDAAGAMKTSLVADKNPFKQDMLNQNDCYILDNGLNNNIFVWKGQKASKEERKAAKAAADKFIADKNYSSKTQVLIVPAGSEPTMFKQFFFKWFEGNITGPGQTHTVGRIAKVEQIPFDPSNLHNNPAMAAQYGVVDDGSGKVQIWRVEGGDKVAVDKSTYGQFFGGDCYLVLYSYNSGSREKHIIYTWQGQKCTQDELTASAFLTVKLDDSMNGVATQVRVTQGKEPPHLVSLFKDKPMVIHQGGTSRKCGETKPSSTRLFHIRKSGNNTTRAVEVEPTASSLNTNDVFVLKTPDCLFLWKGKGASSDEMAAANYVASLLGGTATGVEETQEPAVFWAALGGKKEYQTSKALQGVVRQPRLFGCSNKTGRLTVSIQVSNLNVVIVNGPLSLLYRGDLSSQIHPAFLSAKQYVDSDPSGRRGTPITILKQGEEIPSFTGWFQAWDPKMWSQNLYLSYSVVLSSFQSEPLIPVL